MEPQPSPVIRLPHRVNAYLLPEVVMSPFDRINFKLEPDPRTKTNGQQMLRIPGVFGCGATNVYSNEKIKINRIALAWKDEIKGDGGFIRLYLNVSQTQEVYDVLKSHFGSSCEGLIYIDSPYTQEERSIAKDRCLEDDSHLPSFLLRDGQYTDIIG